eukprot:CAMPEP_0203764150 /NCGR_PEP_ID=MMETSP0098-20131031/17468_1 /ASSEMBLY_ACC=CAM_ASM_000208 /TAXON_ID=96639 /ORGANISM=" , Strain NY0313808BC1" /LENGTH=469 /DNA_ID=CAMNT_0050659875 /DNA_START=752 /DNA_END=2161 /DNA_ORIENTATION=+
MVVDTPSFAINLAEWEPSVELVVDSKRVIENKVGEDELKRSLFVVHGLDPGEHVLSFKLQNEELPFTVVVDGSKWGKDFPNLFRVTSPEGNRVELWPSVRVEIELSTDVSLIPSWENFRIYVWLNGKLIGNVPLFNVIKNGKRFFFLHDLAEGKHRAVFSLRDGFGHHVSINSKDVVRDFVREGNPGERLVPLSVRSPENASVIAFPGSANSMPIEFDEPSVPTSGMVRVSIQYVSVAKEGSPGETVPVGDVVGLANEPQIGVFQVENGKVAIDVSHVHFPMCTVKVLVAPVDGNGEPFPGVDLTYAFVVSLIKDDSLLPNNKPVCSGLDCLLMDRSPRMELVELPHKVAKRIRTRNLQHRYGTIETKVKCKVVDLAKRKRVVVMLGTKQLSDLVESLFQDFFLPGPENLLGQGTPGEEPNSCPDGSVYVEDSEGFEYRMIDKLGDICDKDTILYIRTSCKQELPLLEP